jgi:hypothetical protein
MEQNKKIQIIVEVVVIIGVALVLLAWYLLHGSSSAPATTRQPVTLSNTVVNVSSTQLPKDFPSNIPFIGQVEVVDNYNATSPGGQFQATRSFKAIGSVPASYQAYKTFLGKASSGWTIISENNNTSTAQESLLAQNATAYLTVRVSTILSSPVPEVLVELTYATKPTSK